MSPHLTDWEWESYEREGFLRLGRVLSPGELAGLQARIDDIMLGRAAVDYDRLLMQLDSETGRYEELGEQTRGFKGATLHYRKIQDLEADALFLEYLGRPLFREICRRVYGAGTPVAVYRAMFMNKPARRGTFLPWHQDRWVALDRDPLITVWTALDPATIANGCVQVIRGSHRLGLINPSHHSAFLTEEQAAALAPAERVEFLELEAGEAVLLHNWLLHASDVNRTDSPRRAFGVCYMDGRTQSSAGDRFPVVFPEV